jgi:hypothetical protein
MDKVELHLKKILSNHLGKTDYGNWLFDKHPPRYGFTGLITKRYYTKANDGKHFYLVEWARGSCDYRIGSINAFTGVSNWFVQGYFAFDSKRNRDCAYLILEDKRLTKKYVWDNN